uniref:Zinc finger, CCHC-type n=1 Tax=Tanacetum cinerariifolium TaxID=118510 RepID=A0A699GJ53_TANCI|nr:zinc finger, CCHC-type [Tanacetum cinerariifolium]
MMVQTQEEIGKGSANPTDPHHTPTIVQLSTSQPQKKQKPKKTKRKDTELPQTSGPTTNVADEAVNKKMNDSLVRATTTASSLEAEQDSGNINKTQSKATLNESSSQGTNSGGGPRCQEAIGDTTAQTRSERVFKFSNDLLLVGVNIPQSDEDSLKLKVLMELCTNLQNRVPDLETTKTTQAMKIENIKRRVKKLKKKQRSRTHKLKRLYKVGLTARVESSDDDEDLGKDASKQERISDIDSDEGITLASTHDNAKMFDVDQYLGGEEVFVAKQDENVVEKEVDQVQVTTAATTPTISIDKVTLAQALTELKHTKPKAKANGIVFHELEESTTTTTTTIPKLKSQDKKAWNHFKELLQNVPHHGIDIWLQVQIFYDHVNPITRRTIDQSTNDKLRDINTKESWVLFKDIVFYDNESWNDPRDFAEPAKEISLPQNVLSTSDRHLIGLENQVQRLMEAHLALMQPTNKAKEEEREREGNPNTIVYNEEQRNTPQLEWKDITVVDNLSPNREDEGIEWKHGFMTFMNEIKEITFKMTYKHPERSKLSNEGHGLLSSRVILNKDEYDRGCRKLSDLEDGFYRDTIKLEPEYLTGMDNEGEVT